MPNHNTNLDHNSNFRQNGLNALHAIWHALNKPVWAYTFTQCDGGGATVICIMTINSKTNVPVNVTYWNPDGTTYGGNPALLVTCP